jgi:outer membrane lipoprotein-sorting protein
MPLVNGSIPSLINGVSQQPDSMRLPTQGVEQINGVSSLLDGLGKRPPTSNIAKISNSNYVYPYVHFVDRDETERYILMVYPDRVVAVGTDGTQYPVFGTPADFDYLKCQNPSQQIKCLTISDVTFVLNRTVVTKLNPQLSPTRFAEALVWIRGGSYKTQYSVTVSPAPAPRLNYTSTTETSATDPATIKTDNIAGVLATDLLTNTGSVYAFFTTDNAIWIQKKDGKPFTLDVTDSAGNTMLSSAITQVQHFSDLPAIAPNGFTVKVIGDVSSDSDDYWVKFSTTGGTIMGKGIWKECSQPGTVNTFDATTMPHILTRKQDVDGTVTGTVGTIYFDFGVAPWKTRNAGDDDHNPAPTFIGRALSDIFLHRNRLGALAGGSLCMSQSGDLYNFWRQTNVTLLDNDPIDVTVAHHRAVNMRHGVSFADELLLFADHTQFSVKGGDVLSPKTVSVQVTTEYSSHLDTPPVPASNNLYFPFDNGDYSGVREYYVQGLQGQKVAKPTTDHCSRYITGSITKMVVSPIQDMLLCLSSVNRNHIWVYRYFWNGQDKVQSSWSRWTFGTFTTILGLGFLGDVMYLVNVYSDGTYLEKVRIDPGYADPFAQYLTLLDRRVAETQCGTSYDPIQNTTTITPPYLMPSEDAWQVVTRAASNASWVPGRVVTQISHSQTQIVVQGDVRAGFWLGRSYDFRYTFGKGMLHSVSQVSGTDNIVTGRLQLKDWEVKFARTGYFRAEVTAEQRDTAAYLFTGQSVRVPAPVYGGLGRVQLRDGSLRFPVQSRNTNVKIELVNDTHLPCYITGAEWVANYWTKAARV